MRSNVASMGDMAFLERKIFLFVIFLIPSVCLGKMPVLLFNLYEVGICILSNSGTEQESVHWAV